MSIGQLRHKATIYNPSTQSDGQGGSTLVYSVAGSCYMGFIEFSDNESETNYKQTRKAITRVNSKLSKDSVIEVQNTRYAVKYVRPKDDRNAYIILGLEAQ